MSSFDLSNKNILITGASKGLGSATAVELSKYNANLHLIARSDKELKKTRNKCKNSTKHKLYSCNLRDKTQLESFLKIIAKINIDIVIHCLGGALGKKDNLAKIEDWQEVWNFNVGIGIEINNILIPKMKAKKYGRIIHISSSYSINGSIRNEPYGGSSLYSCSKAFLNMYVKTLSKEISKYNIAVNALLPGPFLSKGKHWHKLKNNDPNLYSKYIKENISIGRMAKYSDILPFIKFLCSNESNYMIGSLINIDGGVFN